MENKVVSNTGERQEQSSQKWIEKKLDASVLPYVKTLEQWKKLKGIPENIKVYIITGNNQSIKNYFGNLYGWTENTDPDSHFYDFKWTVKRKQIPFHQIFKGAKSNHFQSAVSYLKGYINGNIEYNEQVQMSYNILKRIYQEKQGPKMQKNEWEIISKNDMTQEQLKQKKHQLYLDQLNIQFNKIPQQQIAKNNNNKKTKSIKVKVIDKEFVLKDSTNLHQNLVKIQKQQVKKVKIPQKEQEEEKEQKEQNEQCQEKINMQNLLNEIQKQSPNQYNLTGSDNIWIIKPGNSSRGRGIQISNNLVELQSIGNSKMSNWVVQKYIENPLILQQRKFDIRVWVLVTKWSPSIQVWKYDDFYVRMSGDIYKAESLDCIQSHLTNNAITKFSKQQKVGHDNMYFQDEFYDLIEKERNISNIQAIKQKINIKINQAINSSLQACKKSVQHDKGQFELLGYDFMIDEQFDVWMIEINASPDLSYSTHVTECLVKNALPSVLDIVLQKDIKCQDEYKNWIKIGNKNNSKQCE